MLFVALHDSEDGLAACRAIEFYVGYLLQERRDTPNRQDEIDSVTRVLVELEKRLFK